MKLTFKAKVFEGNTAENLQIRQLVQAPKEWKLSHVSEAGKVSSYINSNMLGLAIDRELKRAGFNKFIDVDNPPENVQIERLGPLAMVTVSL